MNVFRRHGDDGDDDGGAADHTALLNTRTGDPWMGQPKYTKGIVTVCCILIIIAALLSIPSKVRRYRYSTVRQSNSIATFPRPATDFSRRFTSIARFLAYRQLPSYRLGMINFRLPALGVTLVMSLFMLGFTIWAFVVQPYYRVDRSAGSPPLALRTGMMAVGLMPFVYVLGSKVNFISMLTGTSHERLQVYHRWIARFMLFMATVHTIPFIHQPLHDGGVAELKEWYFSDNMNITGTVAYACLFVLVFGSMAGLRERCYEVWVITHIPLALVFLAYLFIHCEQLLTSWRYLWGAAALYMLSVFLRLARKLSINNFLFLSSCQVEALEEELTRLTIRTPIAWKPGQHVFVRFPFLEPWSSHPFTIVSIPTPDPHGNDSAIVLMAKAQKGLTKRLHNLAQQAQSDAGDHEKPTEGNLLSRPSIKLAAIIDGPYGQDAGVADFDQILFVAGGSGVSFALSSLLDLAWHWQQGKANTRRVHFIWSIRQLGSVNWAIEHLRAVESIAPAGQLRISLFVSGVQQATDVSTTIPSTWDVVRGHHPDMTEAIRSFAADAPPATDSASSDVDLEKKSSNDTGAPSPSTGPQSTAVLVCGPRGMAFDASQEAARLQLDIVRGRAPHLSQLYLINENFGW